MALSPTYFAGWNCPAGQADKTDLFNLVFWLLLLTIVGLFGWLAHRTKSWPKRLAFILSGCLLVAIVLVGGFYLSLSNFEIGC